MTFVLIYYSETGIISHSVVVGFFLGFSDLTTELFSSTNYKDTEVLDLKGMLLVS